MKNTANEIIKDSKLWAGLNKPEMSLDEADVVIFGMPYDGSVQWRSGTRNAPEELRSITYTISPTTETFEDFSDLKVLDIGDFKYDTQEEMFDAVAEKVGEIVANNKFFTMIGGDHSTTIGVYKGIDKSFKGNLGIIHIDAHFDLCDTQKGSKTSHASTERRALELNCVKNIDSLFFVGIRSIESDELDFFNNNNINVIGSKEFYKIGTEEVIRRVKQKMSKFDGIYVTIDIDCLDPAYAAGTGTPQFGGLTSRQLLDLVEGIFEMNVIGMDIVEVAPNLDDSLAALFAARKLVTETWGHYYRKIYDI